MKKEVKCTTLETSDRMKKVWLVGFKGFTLQATRREPRAGLFGKIRYKNVWVLKRID